MKLSQKISVALLSLVMLTGISAGAQHHAVHADQVRTTATTTVNNKTNSIKQHNAQNKLGLINKVDNKASNAVHHHNNSWFTDGLSKQNLAARSWVSFHESGHHWTILSYGGRCIGYFQLDPAYLGKKHGHVNLNHKHQVKVADAYAASRYGSWVNAKKFWQAHHWY